MFSFVIEEIADLMQHGGFVMWLLLGLSLAAVSLVFERCWFWAATNRWGRTARIRRLAEILRAGTRGALWPQIDGDRSVYGRLVRTLINEGEGDSESVATEAVEVQRGRLERFMPTLSTIITAAPMLGILGTVLGLIKALQIFAGDQRVTDPSVVSPAIGEALLTTAAGLTIAIGVLFPYNAFRAQVDRTLGRLEALVAAAGEGRVGLESSPMGSEPGPAEPPQDASGRVEGRGRGTARGVSGSPDRPLAPTAASGDRPRRSAD